MEILQRKEASGNCTAIEQCEIGTEAEFLAKSLQPIPTAQCDLQACDLNALWKLGEMQHFRSQPRTYFIRICFATRCSSDLYTLKFWKHHSRTVKNIQGQGSAKTFL